MGGRPAPWTIPPTEVQLDALCREAAQVARSWGWPLFEMTLQNGNAPVILRSILRENRAWCRVLEFAEEFGISVSFEPFTLLERRGG